MKTHGLGGLVKHGHTGAVGNCSKCTWPLRDDSADKPGIIWCVEGGSLVCEFCCKSCSAEKARRNEVLNEER